MTSRSAPIRPSTVDRFRPDSCGQGTKIDNLVQIGHCCTIGEHCLICALVGIAGSTIIGNQVTIAGQVGVAGISPLATRASLWRRRGLRRMSCAAQSCSGLLPMPHKEYKRVSAAIQRVFPETLAKLHELEQQLAELRARQTTTS